MKKKIIAIVGIITIVYAVSCTGGSEVKGHEDANKPAESAATTTSESAPSADAGASGYDPQRGEGKYDEASMKLGAVDGAMASKGKAVAETKCFSCHKVSDEKLVGPGWKGVTERRTPHWLMNFITNPDPMIEKDPEVKAQLEACLVRMPNQNLQEDEARSIVEFMRQNDGAK